MWGQTDESGALGNVVGSGLRHDPLLLIDSSDYIQAVWEVLRLFKPIQLCIPCPGGCIAATCVSRNGPSAHCVSCFWTDGDSPSGHACGTSWGFFCPALSRSSSTGNYHAPIA